MKHEEFEKQMFSHVNNNCKMKELDRQETERAAQEEYRIICKCKKVNAVVGAIVCGSCYTAIVYAAALLNRHGYIPAVAAIAVSAVVGLLSGAIINSLATKIRN